MKETKIEISHAMWEKLQLYTILYDFYGPLLTERQDTCFTMHYLEDMSLSEISESLAITPQAVSEQLKRTTKALRKYEEKLGFIKNLQEQQKQINKISAALDTASTQEIRIMLSELV